MFSSEEKAAARTWMIMWGGFDFCVSLFTFLIFIERNRFRFLNDVSSTSRSASCSTQYKYNLSLVCNIGQSIVDEANQQGKLFSILWESTSLFSPRTYPL
ncbi:hypothetical protein COOONC_05201 [Cooperia oncophora]